MKISFADFWGNFNPSNNFLFYLFQDIVGDVQVTDIINESDLLIYANFGSSHYGADRTKVKKVFYTGENIRPNFNDCDRSLTFDFDDYDGKNVRLPLWMHNIDWYNKGSYGNPEGLIPVEKINSNKFISKEKTKFCCIVNNHFANNRQQIFEKLSVYRTVDGYGNIFNNRFDGECRKYEILSEYKFTICFENVNYPGYHTEKLFHAKTAGCIPLYNGSTEVEKDFNKDCFINLQSYGNVEDYIEHIKEIDNNADLSFKIRSAPLFNIRLESKLKELKTQIQNFIL